MSIFAEEIEELAGNEPIEGVVIGIYGGYSFEDEQDDRPAGNPLPTALRGQLLSWAEARPYLAYEWDTSFGGAECHPVYVWTPTKVIAIHEYDGSTSLSWLPRNPEPGKPEFV